jgi:pimeloyl-ACP methyl ester carboxylesterase
MLMIAISASAAKTAPAVKVAPGPSAVQSQPASTLAASNAPPVIRQSPPSFASINQVIAQNIPGSRLVVIPKAAHLMSYQNPAAFNEALLYFLAQQ